MTDNVNIYPGVSLGRDPILYGPVVLGIPPRGCNIGELPLVIGDEAIIRPFSTIYAGSTIGARFQTGQGVSIRENNVIGDDVIIGTHAVLEFGNRIGNRVRIHTNCFLEMVTIGDDVFIGPHVVFVDDPHPMKCPHFENCLGGAVVEDLVRIGSNSTIMPGVRLGRNSLIGAGSLVLKDVPPNSVVAGHPAKVIKEISDLECFKGLVEKPYSWPPYSME
jgi:acetyltransferase-like isoleucine patch superfamily enzyme